MSNFVTGLVRRGAGLPPRVSIRPATGPLQMPASPAAEGLESRQGITSFPARALSDRDFGLDVRRPDSAVPAEPARLQIPRPTAAPEPVNPRSEERSLNTEETPSLQLRSEPVNRRSGKSSPRTEETLTLQPRSEPPKKAPVATAQLRSEDRSSARTGDAWRLVPQSSASTATPTATSENLEPHTPALQENTPRLIALPEPNPRPDAFSDPTPIHPLPRPTPNAVARVQPAPAASATAGKGKTQDSRSIQVKIGRVEIRSNQPAPVVRTTRPSRTSGFDDLRSARTYLDRGTR
jgi:hypothetical protein